MAAFKKKQGGIHAERTTLIKEQFHSGPWLIIEAHSGDRNPTEAGGRRSRIVELSPNVLFGIFPNAHAILW